MRLLCWLLGHRWFPTVVTHHTLKEGPPDYEQWERGVWRESICLRCQKNEAVYIKTLNSWNIVLDEGEFEFLPDTHMAYPGDW